MIVFDDGGSDGVVGGGDGVAGGGDYGCSMVVAWIDLMVFAAVYLWHCHMSVSKFV